MKGLQVIEVESRRVIRASREAVWRHLIRAGEWYRWYPGLHGTTATESISREGQEWRATGQMGRMLYRGDQRVTEFQALKSLEIELVRNPWLKHMYMRMYLVPASPNCEVVIRMGATPGFSIVGRFLLSGTLRSRLQTEVNAATERLARYVEKTMPYH